MGYTDTTNYKMKKPDASNKFDVMDLNNALDKTDTVLYDNLTAQTNAIADNNATQTQMIADNNAAQNQKLDANDAENKRLISGLEAKLEDSIDETESISTAAFFNKLTLVKSFVGAGTHTLSDIQPGRYFVHLQGGWGGDGGYNGGKGGSGYIYEGIVKLSPTDKITIGANGAKGFDGTGDGRGATDGKVGESTVLTTATKTYTAYGGGPGGHGKYDSFSSPHQGRGGNGYFGGQGHPGGNGFVGGRGVNGYDGHGGNGFYGGTGGGSWQNHGGTGVFGGNGGNHDEGDGGNGGDGLYQPGSVGGVNTGYSSSRDSGSNGNYILDLTEALTFEHPVMPIHPLFLLTVKKIDTVGCAYIFKTSVE